MQLGDGGELHGVDLLMIGMLIISGSTQNESSLWRTLNVGGGTDEALLAWKLMALLADFFGLSRLHGAPTGAGSRTFHFR